MNDSNQKVNPILWSIDGAGRIWQINTNNCTARSCVKLDELPSNSQITVLDSVFKMWTNPIVSRRFCRSSVMSKRGCRYLKKEAEPSELLSRVGSKSFARKSSRIFNRSI